MRILTPVAFFPSRPFSPRRLLSQQIPLRSSLRAMSTPTSALPNGAPRPHQQKQQQQKQQPNKSNVNKQEVKILMLHGFVQSGPLFRAKTRALEKLLVKTLAPFSLLPVLIYPTAPNRLRPSDSPGHQPPQGGDGDGDDDDQLPDTWAWFRKDDAANTYRLFDQGMATVASAIRDAGGIHGVCGFSQGAAMTGFVAAALEPGREPVRGPRGDWARGLREANAGRPARFAVSYSGFFAAIDDLQWLYEPKVATPTLHYIGSLDTVVDESRSRGFVDRCKDPVVVVHPGGHHVPVAKEWVMPLAGFIKNHAKEEE